MNENKFVEAHIVSLLINLISLFGFVYSLFILSLKFDMLGIDSYLYLPVISFPHRNEWVEKLTQCFWLLPYRHRFVTPRIQDKYWTNIEKKFRRMFDCKKMWTCSRSQSFVDRKYFVLNRWMVKRTKSSSTTGRSIEKWKGMDNTDSSR